MSHDLLHEALIRKMRIDAAMRGQQAEALSPDMAGTSGASDSGLSDDGGYTPVHTRPGTPVGTPRRSHFAPGSGASTPSASRSSSPTRRRRERKALEEQEKRTSRDPLRRLENEVSSRIFRELDVTALARCKRVSKRWNRSATINWAWYLRFQEQRLGVSAARSTLPSMSQPIWTRKESRENWASRYRSAFTLNGLQYATAAEADLERARSDGYLTPREEREERWAEQAAASSSAGGGGSALGLFGGDKVAAREWYKGLGGRTKVKGKGGHGSGGAAGPRDLTGFGDDDGY